MCKTEERPLFHGVTYSVEAGNPDQTLLLNDLKDARGLGEGEACSRRREELLSTTAVLGAERSRHTWGDPPPPPPTAFPR